MLTGPGRLRIAILGTRGVPAGYSGFETCAEEVGARLGARGHAVTVYCRVLHIAYAGAAYRGIRLVKLPTIRSKHLDTITHTFLSSLHALEQRYDIALYFNVGKSPVTWIPRLAGQRVVLNVDGLDWRRRKWENLETMADAGLSYDGTMGPASLPSVLEGLLKDPALAAEHGRRGLDRVRRH